MSRPNGRFDPLSLDLVNKLENADDIANGAAGGFRLEPLLSMIGTANERNIHLTIDSAGGGAFDAFALYRALLAHRWLVVARIVGRCSSAAPIVALAADQRLVTPSGTVLFHAPRVLMTDPQHQAFLARPRSDQLAMAERLFEIERSMVDCICARLPLSRNDAAAWIASERTWKADECVMRGFADAVCA